MASQDRCLRKHAQCLCLCDCNVITDKEFYKIFELEDTGVALYRYVPPSQDPKNTMGEVYVLRTSDDFELEPNELSLSLAKNKIKCPRCIKLIEKAEASLIGRPSIKQQDIAGICDHCWTPVTKMQRLLQLAKNEEKKERRATAALEAIKAQMEQARGADEDEAKVPEEVKVKERPRTAKLKGNSQTKAEDETRLPKISEKAKANEEKNKVKEVDLKSTADQSLEQIKKPSKFSEKKSRGAELQLQAKSKTKAGDQTADKKSTKIPEKPKTNEEKNKVKEVDLKSTADQSLEQIKKPSKFSEKKSREAELQLQAKSKTKAGDQTADQKSTKIPEKAKTNEEKSKIVAKQKTSTDQLKALIAQEKLKKAKENQEIDNRRKEQEKQIKLAELAEKKAKEAELERSAKARAPPPKLVHDDTDSSEDAPGHELTADKSLEVNDIVIGEKICKNTQRKSEELDTSEILLTTKLGKSGKPRAVKSEQERGPNISKNGPVGDFDEHEKKATEKGRGDKKLALGTEKHKKEPAVVATERSESSKKGNIIDDKVKGAVVGTQSTKKVYATESETPTKVPILGAENVEKATAKSTQDPQIQKKKEKGPISYSLSDRTFIERGWTMLPHEKVVQKMNVYRMRPSRPEFDWFEHHKNKVLEYDTGEILAEVDDAGRGRWYYRSGALAMDYYDAEEMNAGQRFVVYSTGAPDAHGRPRPRTVLATFDHSGSGIVFDHAGRTRLKYNQTEGVVLDRKIGPVSRWKWHSLNDPPVLQQIMIDTQLHHKDHKIAQMSPDDEHKKEDEAMLSIELDNFVKEKTKKSSQDFKPFQIKMKALKINENFSLRVLDQASVYLLYRDGTTNLKINIGMLLDHKEIVDTDTSEIGEVSIKAERLPAYTSSISELQQAVARARAGAAADRERRARLRAGHPEVRLGDIDSVDSLRAAISRPVRTTFFTCSASATQDTPKLLKPCSCDFYCKQIS